MCTGDTGDETWDEFLLNKMRGSHLTVVCLLCIEYLFTNLISTGNFLHFPERCIELANVVMLPPGVIIPHQALWHTQTPLFTIFSLLVWLYSVHTFIDLCLKYCVNSLSSTGFKIYPLYLQLPKVCYSTLSFRSSSQLHRDMRDTLKGSHTGFRLFLITF